MDVSNVSFLDLGASPGPYFDPDLDLDSKLTRLVIFINHELSGMGIKPLKTDENKEVTKLSLALTCSELIERVHKSAKRTEELQLAYKRLSSDNDVVLNQRKKMKLSADNTENEIARLKESERKKAAELSKNLQLLAQEKEQSKKAQAMCQQKINQIQHLLKKKERECAVLKEKVESFVSGNRSRPGTSLKSKTNATPVFPNIEILNENKPKRAKWLVMPPSEEGSERMEMYQSLVTNYESRQKELMLENQELRTSILAYEKELEEMTDIPEYTELEQLIDSPKAEKRLQEIENTLQSMPYELVREDLDSFTRKRWRILKEYVKRIETSGSVDPMHCYDEPEKPSPQPKLQKTVSASGLLTDDEDSDASFRG